MAKIKKVKMIVDDVPVDVLEIGKISFSDGVTNICVDHEQETGFRISILDIKSKEMSFYDIDINKTVLDNVVDGEGMDIENNKDGE